jgi:ribosome-associated toxin RatA of RatAB toxin-antitoxin module
MEGTVQSIEASVPAADVFDVAADLEVYPEWISAIKDVEILDRDDAGHPRRVRFTTDVVVRKITYVLVYSFDPPHRIEWVAEQDSDIKAMDGYYEFKELEDGGTEIVYALRVETAFSVPGFLRKQGEKQLVNSALRGLKRRAEAVES